MSGIAREFVAGAWSFRVDTDTGMVRNVRFAGHEVVRGIYPAVRERDWSTVRPMVAPLRSSVSAEVATLCLTGRVCAGAVDLEWEATIEAQSEGSLRYRWRGHALGDFSTMRTGLCVLHPAEIAGTPCVVKHPDGTVTRASFPQSIAPRPPFHNVRAITHGFGHSAEVTIEMRGEVFETEDQRNWTDASFKTYCRPLDWPRPYTVKAGSIIEHAVLVSVRGSPVPLERTTERPRLRSNGKAVCLPRVGFDLPGPFSPEARSRVRALRPSHLRVESTESELPATLAWAGLESSRIECELEIAVHGATSRPPPRNHFPTGSRVYLFDGDGNGTTSEVVAAWRRAGFAVIGTGTLQNFAELNQQPPVNAGHDITCFGINAQVHTFDDASMLETLTQHQTVALQAQAIGGGVPVVVAPVFLGPAADSADARLHSGFAARWILGCLVRLAAAGTVERVTFMRAEGPGGFLREDQVTPAEQLFLTLAGHDEVSVLESEQGDAVIDALLVTAGQERFLLVGHDAEFDLEVEIPFSGRAGPLGDKLVPFGGGIVALPPRAVWQVCLSR